MKNYTQVYVKLSQIIIKEQSDMNIKKELETKAGPAGNMHLNNIDLDPLMIKAVMINEVVIVFMI